MPEIMCPVCGISWNSMDTACNSVRISLALEAKVNDQWPQIAVGIDQHRFDIPPLAEIPDVLVLEHRLEPGCHRLWIDIGDPALFEIDPHMAVVIDSVRFQHVRDDFKIFSSYQPQYPRHWIRENQLQDRTLSPVIHSNYLGWPGRWWIDFETPVYAWIHQKLNLGWLI